MHKLEKVKSEELFPLVDEIIKQDASVWITVTGMSMYPFLRDGKDEVELTGATFENVRKGDIVLFKRTGGAYVLHRILRKKTDCFYIVGDAQQRVEGPIVPEQLKARVTRVKRGERVIDCNSIFMKTAVALWMVLLPFRTGIIKGYGKIRRRVKAIG